MEIFLSAKINPSEDVEKIREALTNISPLSYSIERGLLRGYSEDRKALLNIFEKIRSKQSIRAVRRLLLRGIDDNSSTVLLNREAAYVGSVAFCETAIETPLGPLMLVVKAENIMEFIDWLAPR